MKTVINNHPTTETFCFIQEVTDSHEKDELPMLAWWKVKKWAMHILTRIFERYGNTTTIAKVGGLLLQLLLAFVKSAGSKITLVTCIVMIGTIHIIVIDNIP